MISANNNMNYKKSLIFKVICFGLLVFFISGCGKGDQDKSQNQQTEQTGSSSKEAPKQLTEIENSIEKIILSLKGPAVSVKEENKGDSAESSKENTKSEGTASQGTKAEGTKSQGTKSEGTKSQGTKSEGTQSQSTKSQGTKSESTGTQSTQSQGTQSGKQEQGGEAKKSAAKDPWEEISPILFGMHNKWNSFMPIAAKKGANKDLLDNFSNALNNLTSTLPGKNKSNTLLSANSVYAYIPDFYSLFESKISPEVKKIRYYIRNIILNSDANNWDIADSDLIKLKDSWTLFKTGTSKEQQEITNKLDFSIYELEKVIKIKNKPLIYIKGKVALSNIEALEKSAEKSSS